MRCEVTRLPPLLLSFPYSTLQGVLHETHFRVEKMPSRIVQISSARFSSSRTFTEYEIYISAAVALRWHLYSYSIFLTLRSLLQLAC